MKETRVKINKTESWFFEKINRIKKTLARVNKKEKEKNQINKLRNEKGEVTPDNAEIQRIIGDCYEQLYGNKMDNLEEMDRFLEKFNLPKLNQEEIEREIGKYLETNGNENTTQNLWDAAKAVLRGKFIAIQSYLKKQGKHQIDKLTLHLKQLEKMNKGKKISRRKEIIKI